MGYYLAGFEVVGVDIESQPNYPFEFHQGDALTYPLEGFDAIHASPPCQAYMDTNKGGLKEKGHPRLIEPIRERLAASGLPYIIENVEKAPLLEPWRLCGTMFGLRVIRHRLFEIWPRMILLVPPCNHWGTVAAGDFAGVYAFGGKGHRHGKGIRDPKSNPGPSWSEAMGIDWMTQAELTQAVPPAYCEFLGREFLRRIA